MTNAMAVQPGLEPAIVHAISAADPVRRRLSRTAAVAIAVSVAAHVAVGYYVYQAKYGAPPAPLPIEPPISVTPVVVRDQPPAKPTTPPPAAGP